MKLGLLREVYSKHCVHKNAYEMCTISYSYKPYFNLSVNINVSLVLSNNNCVCVSLNVDYTNAIKMSVKEICGTARYKLIINTCIVRHS